MQGRELAGAEPIVVLAERAISLQGSWWYASRAKQWRLSAHCRRLIPCWACMHVLIVVSVASCVVLKLLCCDCAACWPAAHMHMCVGSGCCPCGPLALDTAVDCRCSAPWAPSCDITMYVTFASIQQQQLYARACLRLLVTITV